MNIHPYIAYKITDIHGLQPRLKHWRAVGDRVVFTNGCFDILHPGHIELLAQCQEFGDHLVLGLNTDASVRRLKGNERPVNDELSRAVVLAALHFVDAVVFFEEDTPLELIQAVNPAVLVKGGDYLLSQIVGAEWVLQQGSEVRIVPLLSGFSTTSLINRLVGK